MKSIKQFFSYMNEIDFPYVVLRNFEGLPEQATQPGHGDIDILVYDLDHFHEIFPDILPTHPSPRVRHKLTIDNFNIYMDVRYVGDGYYPTHFELAILDTREWNEKGFYTPDPNHFRLALVYHVVHHKNENTYPKQLPGVKVKELLEALKKSNIGYSLPQDKTVGSYNQYWKGATSVVSQEGDKIIKRQTGWGGYNLIDNEYRILSKCESRHFPKVYKTKENEIEIENCGDRLTVNNLPLDWKVQMIDILKDLKKHSIVHRDIKPDNLMVKGEIIKLIDFGWAKFQDEEDHPPSCLGFPYKPTWGFEDQFSMKKVIKEMEFQVEESKCESLV